MSPIFQQITIETIFLLFAGILNLVFGLLIFTKDNSRKSNIFFTLITAGVSVWAFARAFFEVSTLEYWDYMWGIMMYYGASLIPISFFFFVDTFGTERLSFRRITIALSVLMYVATGVVIGYPEFLIKEIGINNGYKMIIFGPGLILFSIFIVGYFFASFVMLFRKLFKSNGLYRTQLIYIFLGTFIASVIGVTTNLILPALGYFQLFWLGPVATVIMVGFIAYAVLKHHLFNVRVITAEVFTFFLWVSIATRILLFNSEEFPLFDVILLLLAIIFGVFLVRSVVKEIDRRGEVQTLVKRLRIANEHLRELDRQKTEFVSIASHQLRTPLTAIKGYSSMILEESFGKVCEEVKEPIERIFRSSERLTNIVEDFLNVARIEQGRITYDTENVDMYKIVKGVVDELRFFAEEKKLVLQIKCQKNPLWVIGDADKLRQVVLNLVDNAIKYTPSGEVIVSVGEEHVGKKQFVILTIQDTGIGIPESFSDEMFGKFNRAENSSAYHANGSGIGLYISNEIIKAHHGIIEVDSKEGKGTTFSVTLPGNNTKSAKHTHI
jgi:signal transduction histidine kinase